MNIDQLKALELVVNIKTAQVYETDLTPYVEFLEESTTFSEFQIKTLLERIYDAMNYRDIQVAAEYIEDHLGEW